MLLDRLLSSSVVLLIKLPVSSPQADADDIDTWMLDVLRIVSSVDVGHDEFSAQALVKKHKDVAEEIASYRPVIDALHEQSRTLPPEKANSEEVRLKETLRGPSPSLQSLMVFARCRSCLCRSRTGWRASRSATRRWWS